MSRAEDKEILKFAQDRAAIAVTLDADFHAILAVTRARSPSVVRIRVQGLSAAPVADIVSRAISQFARELESGRLVTIKANKMTCHRLPIGGDR